MIKNLSQGGDKKFRVALMGIYHESNTFIESSTVLQDFINGHWLKGETIRLEYQHAHHEIGGMYEILDKHNIEIVPVMFAEATPGGVINTKAYQMLLEEMMGELTKWLPVDACLVVPHGAGVAEGYADMDGHWLSVLRKIVGKNIPIVGTLDPHANVSQLMLQSTDALVAYKTNPHIDQRETGKTAAQLLLRFLNKEIKPVQVLKQTPVAISIEQQYTSAFPCRQLYDLAKEIGNQEEILSVSILLGFPYADVEEMGSSFIVVANGSESAADTAAEKLKSFLVHNKEKFVGEKKDIHSILPVINESAKPVLLLDMGDNIGGGSLGSSFHLLQALENYEKYKSFFCIFDPEAVNKASTYSINQEFGLYFGNKDGMNSGQRYFNTVRLLHKGGGKFKETSPRHGGQLNYDMGDIVIVETQCGNIVMLNSLRIPPFSLSQLTTFGIDPADFDVITAKGVNAPIAAYGVVCPTIIQVNTPGVTKADMTLFSYKNRRKPLFPFEKNL